MTTPPYLANEFNYIPTHPNLFKVSFAKGEFSASLITEQVEFCMTTILLVYLPTSAAISSVQHTGRRECRRSYKTLFFANLCFAPVLQDFAKNDTICLIENILPGTKAYSSVQVLADPPISSNQDLTAPRHIELCSDLLYVNHSCQPNVAFEVPQGGIWRVRALTDLPKGTVSSPSCFKPFSPTGLFYP